jgi:hypothetical protein
MKKPEGRKSCDIVPLISPHSLINFEALLTGEGFSFSLPPPPHTLPEGKDFFATEGADLSINIKIRRGKHG